MNIAIKIAPYLLAITLVLFSTSGFAQPATTESGAAKSPDGKTLLIPESIAGKGTVYYALPDRDRQLYLESNAPLENIKGQSNQIIGYAVAGNVAAGEPPIFGSEFQLPVTSIKTGIDLRDEHMAGADWLDAKKFPTVLLRSKEVENYKVIQETDQFTRYSGTIKASLTLHGVTRDITIPDATVVVMKPSERTAKIAKGQLLAVRANFSVTLADYGIKNSIIGDRVAKTVDLQISLFLSNTPPSKQ